jgi:hypothetical protein
LAIKRNPHALPQSVGMRMTTLVCAVDLADPLRDGEISLSFEMTKSSLPT